MHRKLSMTIFCASLIEEVIEALPNATARKKDKMKYENNPYRLNQFSQEGLHCMEREFVSFSIVDTAVTECKNEIFL